jgi:hypothetical protein
MFEGRIVPILCPTREHQGAMARTIVMLMNTIYKLGGSPAYFQTSAHGYAFVRTNLFQVVMEELKCETVRGFMIDDDILVTTPCEELCEIITKAETEHLNIVGPYKTSNVKDEWAIMHPPGHMREFNMFTQADFEAGEPWSPIWAAGLGFYYGDLPLTYRFHERPPYDGEDINFFAENDLHPVVAPVSLYHCKRVLL